jgi:hypothetical protein
MSTIVYGTIEVLSKALARFAGEDRGNLVRPSEVTLIIGISDITVEEPNDKNPIKRVLGEPYYRVIKQGKPYMRARKLKDHPIGQVLTDEVSFLQVLDSKVDFFQVEAQAKPFLVDAFNRFVEELNSDLLNNEGFKAFIESEVKSQSEGKNEEEVKTLEAQLINENIYEAADLELWIITPKKEDVPGLAPNKQDYLIEPVAFLYAGGEKIRQLEFGPDVFGMQE